MEKSNRKKIVVSADDFGRSELANRNILSLAKAGKLDRVAVMVERDYLAGEDIEDLKNTGVSLDIHLELPHTKNRKRNPRHKVMRRGLDFLLHCALRRNGGKKIQHEWEAQIEKFRELFGKLPDGINSHEYIHFFPPYFKAAVDLAEKHKIGFVRFGKNGPIPKKSRVSKILGWLHKMNNRKFKRSGLETTGNFISLDWIRNFKLFLGGVNDGTTELISHPEREEEFELIKKYF